MDINDIIWREIRSYIGKVADKLIKLIRKYFSCNQELIDKCFDYLAKKNYENAIKISERALKHCKSNYRVYLCLAKAYLSTGRCDSFKVYLKKAKKFAHERSDLMRIRMEIRDLMGDIYRDKLRILDRAEPYYYKALNLATKLNDREYKTHLLKKLASIYDQQGKYEDALSCCEKLLEIQPDEEKAVTYNHIAQIYVKQENYENAKEYFIKAKDNAMRCGNYTEIAKAEIGLGCIYTRLKDYQNAEKYLREGFERIQQLNEKQWKGYAYECLCELYHSKGDLNKALSVCEESLKYKTDEAEKIYTYMRIGEIYCRISVNYIEKNNYQKATEYLNKCIELLNKYIEFRKRLLDTAQRHGDNYMYANVAIELGEFYRKIGDFQRAEHYLRDALDKIQKLDDNKIQELYKKYLEMKVYRYLGWLYCYKKDKALAKEYLTKAKELAKEIKEIDYGFNGHLIAEELNTLEEKCQRLEPPLALLKGLVT